MYQCNLDKANDKSHEKESKASVRKINFIVPIDLMNSIVRCLFLAETDNNSVLIYDMLFSSACMNANDPNTLARYRAGYNECASEMTRYLMSLDGLDPQIRARLLAHLATFCTPCGPLIKPTMTTKESLQQLQQPQTITIPGITQPMGPTNFTTNLFTAKQTEISPGSLFNATQFQIIPAQLANGKIAAVLVQSQNSPLAMVSSPQLLPVYDKAFPSQVSRTDNDPLWRPW